MKLDTIVYIKDMLETQVDVYREMFENASQALVDAEAKAHVSWNTPDSRVSDEIRSLRDRKRKKREKFETAYQALSDFRVKEWD